MRLLSALALGSVLALGACGQDSVTPEPAAPGPGLAGAWELVEARVGGAPLAAPAGARATLVVEEGTLGGTSFCNAYGSPYSVSEGALVLEGLAGTETACAPEVMAAEEAYLQALRVDGMQVTVEGDRLVLAGGNSELRFRRLAPVPAADLVGTRWVLETVVDGDVASSVGGGPATLLLEEDGSFTGSTGCRRLSGTWEAYGDEVRLTSLRADGECPGELRDQDGVVVDVLGDGFRADVDGDRLTVHDGGDVQLGYRPEQ